MTEPRISAGAAMLDVRIVNRGRGRYRVKDIFTTHRGSWEPDSSDAYAVPWWAREAYLSPAFDDAGADHHLFVRVQDPHGQAIPTIVEFTTEGGLRDLKDTGNKKSGWQNVPIWNAGWTWGPLANEQVTNGQRPWEHVSTFVVYEMGAVPEPDPDPEPTGELVTAIHTRGADILGVWSAESIAEMVALLREDA